MRIKVIQQPADLRESSLRLSSEAIGKLIHLTWEVFETRRRLLPTGSQMSAYESERKNFTDQEFEMLGDDEKGSAELIEKYILLQLVN